MARIELDEELMGNIVGGSIVISPDKTTCGYNCNNQYKINNFNAMKQYYSANCRSMNEPTMLQNMVANGWITPM